MPDNGDTLTTAAAGPAARPAPGDPKAPAPDPQRLIRLGEELPIFCEACGYSLHGLPRKRCGHCDVLHLACPECNHHQPINTLRPAFQRMLGRLRSMGLAFVVLLKVLFFFWGLMMWGAAGTEFAYRYNYTQMPGGRGNYTITHHRFIIEEALSLLLLGVIFAMVARMLLLRWRRGPLIGLVLAGLICLAMWCGAWFRYWTDPRELPFPGNGAYHAYILFASAGAVVGASVAWVVWLSFVRVFLPPRPATALIEWQRAMSARPGSTDRTDVTVSADA